MTQTRAIRRLPKDGADKQPGRKRQAEESGEFHLTLGPGQQEHNILLCWGSPMRNSSTAQLLGSRTGQLCLSESAEPNPFTLHFQLICTVKGTAIISAPQLHGSSRRDSEVADKCQAQDFAALPFLFLTTSHPCLPQSDARSSRSAPLIWKPKAPSR